MNLRIFTINPILLLYNKIFTAPKQQMQADKSDFLRDKKQKIIAKVTGPIFFFQTTHTHVIYVTQTQIRILMLLSVTPVQSIAKIDGKNILRMVTQKNIYIAILYKNHTLEIRDVNQISKVVFTYKNIIFSAEDISKGFPKIYFKQDDLYLLNPDRLELFYLKQGDRKIYTDIIKQAHGSENLCGIGFSNLIENQKIAILQFKNRITFSFVPISITFMDIKQVTNIKILTTTQFFQQPSKQSYLIRQYVILIIANTRMEVYNLISMKKLLEIQYDTQMGSKIEITTDFLDNFVLLTIYRAGSKQISRNVLYRINVQYYYEATSQYFKESQPFFDCQVELSREQTILLTGDYGDVFSKLITGNLNPLDRAYPKCDSVSAISLRQAHQPLNKKAGKKKQKSKKTLESNKEMNYEIVLSLFNVSESPSYIQLEKKNKLPFPSQRLKSNWGELRQWKQMILSYIQMKHSLDQINMGYDDKDDSGTYHPSQNYLQLANQYSYDDENYLTQDPCQKDKTNSNKTLIKVEKPDPFLQENQVKPRALYEMNDNEEQIIKLRNSLEDAAERFKYQKFQQMLMREENGEDIKPSEKSIEIQFIKFMKDYLKQQNFQLDSDKLFHVQVEKLNDNNFEEFLQEETDQNQCGRKIFQFNLRGERNQLKTEPTTTPEKQKMAKTTSSKNLNKNSWELHTDVKNNISLNSIPTQAMLSSSFSEQKKIQKCQSDEQSEPQNSDSHQLFDSMLYAIQASIEKGFIPLEDKLDRIQQKLDRYSEKHITGLERYSKYVQSEGNYLNNIDSMIHGYCFQLMGQFSDTIQTGIKDYWHKIDQIDKIGKKQRNRTINEFGMFIDQQIRERESIFDQNRMTIDNHLAHLRKSMSKTKQMDINYNEHKNYQKTEKFFEQEVEFYDDGQDLDEDKELYFYEQEKVNRKKQMSRKQSLSALLSLLRSKPGYKHS